VKTPDITPAQILAVIGWAAAQGVAYGAISSQTEGVVLSVAATVVAAAWKIADSIIRQGRAKASGLATKP
jgi:hypothetical protein